MATVKTLLAALDRGGIESRLAPLYGTQAPVLRRQAQRIRALLEAFGARQSEGGGAPVELYSAPGRTEVGGNHTDHNAGRVLAAAVNLDALAAVRPRDDGLIRVLSTGYPELMVRTGELQAVAEERHSPASVVRGIAARMRELGHGIGGFDAVVHGTVPVGSGLSSSASFEVLIATVLNHLYNGGRVDPVECAQIGQYAENVYFGKPCGLMDQTTSAIGGVVTIDFRDAARPEVRKVEFDFASRGISVVVVNTGGSHADLTPEYTAVREEMQAVARELGREVLRETSAEEVLRELPRLRERVGDRAVLRALHFFSDNARVVAQAEALGRGDLGRFLELVIESGRSSWMLNQNCYAVSNVRSQPLCVALELSARILSGRGAWRVHGGGFAGTIQAFVPHDLLQRYLESMRGIFGESSCLELSIRPSGAGELRLA